MQLLLLFLACRPDADSKPDDGTVDSQNLRPLDGDGDGWEVESGDCDDSDASVYPGATELCDGEDDNCDGVVDEGVQSTFYADSDGDGYGEPSTTRLGCMAPDGYVALGTDCDDSNIDIHPDAPERCNALDDDCDDQIDEDVTNVWYYDADQDGYGDLNTSIDDCNPPSGYVVDATDCDDSSAEAFPGHPEICDTRDNDCNGLTDDGVTTIWYADTDGDGYGQSSLTQAACAPPEGYVATDGDCDDQNAAIYPTADELCNGIDDNCDGQIDEDGAADAPLWYADNDSDGYGNIAVVFSSCELPTGYVSNADDCDDSDIGINPAALETCNGIDDNCDGQVDENSAVDAQNWYADGDGDGYGDARVVLSACTQPAGYVADLSDCNDGAAQAHPGAVESCDLLDNDCDGIVDNNATDALTWYQDADGDRFGDANSIVYSCYAPAGYVSTATDCDDSRADVWPNAPEVCDNADNDCDTQIDEGATDALTWYQDNDQDGFGNAASILRRCSQPAGYVADALDCNDQANLINPAAAELCDGVDNDCDTHIDQNAVDAPDWYIDVDGDGFGNSRIYQASCSQPAGYVADATDCDDLQLSTHPGADEYCDGIDNNCNGSTDESTALDALNWYRDADQDGFGTVNLTQRACTQPSGYVADASDCDDTSNSNYPGATEVCDLIDNNCDGTVDDPADLLGSAAACGARNCAEIQSTRLVAGDGEYWLSFNNSPLVVYCDMQTAGGGWTVIHPDDIGSLGSLNSMRDDTTRAMAYLRDNNGNRYYTEVEQLAAFNTYPVRVEDQDSSRMRITFVPRPDSNVQGQTQGFRSNGQDLTFTNCDGNGNSYIEFWHTGLNYVWNQDYRISLQWRDSKIASPSTVPDDYFTYTAIHFGGCGTHSTSGYWSAYDNMRDAAIAIY